LFVGEEGKEFVMTKRHMIEPVLRGPETSAVWIGVGRQLRRRRCELGFGIDHVARCAGISADDYERYEAGAPIRAAPLARIADLFDVPVVWFFQDVAHEEPDEREDAPAADPVVYTVATMEHRAQALVDCFRRLDLEDQQHLLAISMALTRGGAGATPD
jgi:transcriptional regulator with XRE-family HTH domain